MKRFVEGVDRGQSTLFPDRLEDWIGDDNPVRVIDVFVDELDLGGLGFDRVAPQATGRPSYRWCRKVGGKLENWRKLLIVKHSERRCAAAERSLRHETSYGIDVAQSIFR